MFVDSLAVLTHSSLSNSLTQCHYPTVNELYEMESTINSPPNSVEIEFWRLSEHYDADK